MTLIEEDTALVSWKPPEGERMVVSRYTILYASRKAWIAGDWQVLHREGKPSPVAKEKRNPAVPLGLCADKAEMLYQRF